KHDQHGLYRCGQFVEMVGPYFFAFDGLQRPFGRFGVIPETGVQRDILLGFYPSLSCINVEDAASGKLVDPSSPVSVPWSWGKGKEFGDNCTSQQFYLSLATMALRDKIYFASDFHLGAHPRSTARERELRIVSWLDTIKVDAAELYLMGDVFDFWFEYATVVPKGYIRFLGSVVELVDLGVEIVLFKGNHDMWMFGYLKNELGAEIMDNDLVIERGGKTFYLHHGDGLGPGDRTYKLLKKIFRSRFCQWLFARLHPRSE